MDAEIILAEGSQQAANKTKPRVAAATARPPNIHHFVFYGQASRDDVAVFAAAKAFLEGAIYTAPRETDGRTAKGGPKTSFDGRNYIVRLPRKGPIAARSIYLNGEFSDAEEAESGLEITVHFAPKQSGDMPAAVGYGGSLGRSIFDFTVINRSIIHCIRALSGGSAMVP